METSSVLKIDNLSFKPYKNVYFHNINVDFAKGEIIGLIGKNGAGKSTFLMKVAGFGTVDKKKIFIDGIDVFECPEISRTKMACVFDSTKLYPFLTGEKNLQIFKQESNPILKSNIDDFQMNEQLKKKVKNYSLGMHQKIKLVGALNPNKKLILLDEPTNGLDPQSLEVFNEKLKELKKSGTTVIISSHHINDLKNYCTDFYLLHNGELSKIKPKEEFLYDLKVINMESAIKTIKHSRFGKIISVNEYITISLNTEEDISKIIKLLIDKDIEIREVVRKSTIESDFIKETR